MSRNRFEILMQMLHFSDNSNADTTNHLYKLGSVYNNNNNNDKIVNSNYCMQPQEYLCIDESLVKFMGRLRTSTLDRFSSTTIL